MNLMTPPPPISVLWVLLDIIGLTIVGMGFAESVDRLHLFPESIRFAGLGLLMIIGGLACMGPLVWKIRQAVLHVRQQDEQLFKTLPERFKRFDR